ncbi:Uncharacterized protein Rs2_41080 [Raphanus sativus]|nr:Uncharacterized protein Rs2_41080 [Raphanus sativus]
MHPEPYASIRDEIFNIIKMDNQWEEESLKKKLDVFYCRLDNNLNWATKRGELLQKELDMLRNKKENQQKQSPSIDTDDTTLIDMDTSWNDEWNTEFHKKPKYEVRVYDTYQGKKRGLRLRYTDTSEDTYTQQGKATYTKDEVDMMIGEIYEALQHSEDEYYKKFDDIYFPFDNSINTLYSWTKGMQKDTTCN